MIRDTARIVAGINNARDVEYWSCGMLALLFSVVGLWLMQGSRRDDRRMTAGVAAMQIEARFANLETSLQRALEMEHTEEATYDVIAQALTIVAPDVPSEMLLADSSQAHFRQVFSTAPAADAACRVGAPGECPATLSGQIQHFTDSSQLDTCPYLRGRCDAVWATCVPVGIAGRTTGVLHMQRAVDSPLRRHRPGLGTHRPQSRRSTRNAQSVRQVRDSGAHGPTHRPAQPAEPRDPNA